MLGVCVALLCANFMPTCLVIRAPRDRTICTYGCSFSREQREGPTESNQRNPKPDKDSDSDSDPTLNSDSEIRPSSFFKFFFSGIK